MITQALSPVRDCCYDSQKKEGLSCLMHFQSGDSKCLVPVQEHMSRAPVVTKSSTVHVTSGTLIIPLFKEHYSIEGSVLELKDIQICALDQKYPVYSRIIGVK